MLTIKDLYFSDVSGLALIIPDNEYSEIHEKYVELSKQLKEQLTDEQLKLHERILDTVGQMNAHSNAMHYTQGFRDGAAILIDVMLH